MIKHLLICLYLLVCSSLISDLKAETRQHSDFFEWQSLKGVTGQWQGWAFRVGGQLAVDAIAYDNDNRKDSGLRWKTINLRLSGDYNDRLLFFAEPDLLGIDTPNNLYEAWAGWNIAPSLQVRAGQIKVALNTEFATRQENFPCLGYGFSSYLDNRYDLGVQIDGTFPGKTVWYEAAVTTGHGFDLDGRKRSGARCSLRAVMFPARLFTSQNLLKNSFAGIGLAWGPDYEGDVFLQTPLRSTVLTTRKIDGDAFRSWHVEAGCYGGPVRMGVERVSAAIEDVDIGGGQEETFDQLTSWSAYIAWHITGETVRWERGKWLPAQRENEHRKKLPGLPGALELAFRYSNADIDRRLFDFGLTSYNPSTQEVRTEALNLNWYPRPGLKIMASWVKTIADHELGTLGGTNRDSSYVLRTYLVL